MRKTPNYFENQTFFYPYLECTGIIKLYEQQGAAKSYPGPYAAQMEHQRLIAKQIEGKTADMLQDNQDGNINPALYQQYLQMYQRFYQDTNFSAIPEMKKELVDAEIALHLK